MKKTQRMKLAYLCSALMLTPTFAWSANISLQSYWVGGSNGGTPAGSCSITFGGEQPLKISRTFVVDKNTPDGTVLYSWGYGQFVSDTVLTCTSSGRGNSVQTTTTGEIGTWYFIPGHVFGTSGITTSNSGIELKLYARINNTCGFSGTEMFYRTLLNNWICPTVGEYDLKTISSAGTITVGQSMFPHLWSGQYYLPNITGTSISLRAELVKQGSSVGTGALSIPNAAAILRPQLGGTPYTYGLAHLDGNAIQIVAPACRLKTKDYTIAMGQWTLGSTTSAVYGNQVPVNLSLECSGKPDHVRFRFEDTGTSPSSDRNISLYDAAGGNKISGLEIQLLYSGKKVDIDNTTLTDVGSLGTTKTKPDALPLYDSSATAGFNARYVQNGAITRNASNYSGQVTGKVNMYVTYD